MLSEPELPKVLNIQEVTSGGLGTLEYYRTQYALMTSRPVLQNAVEGRGIRVITKANTKAIHGTDIRLGPGVRHWRRTRLPGRRLRPGLVA